MESLESNIYEGIRQYLIKILILMINKNHQLQKKKTISNSVTKKTPVYNSKLQKSEIQMSAACIQKFKLINPAVSTRRCRISKYPTHMFKISDL